jgi:hypothetical protein
MKINSALLPAAIFAGAALMGPGLCGGRAAPLDQTTAVQTRPDPAAPVITILKAGTEPTPASGTAGDIPGGWMAVEIAGPFEGYVLNKDLTKNLDVKTGGSIYLSPDPGAGVLTVAAKGEKTEITGLRGRWTQIRLDRSVVGYIHVGGAAVSNAFAGQPGSGVPVATDAPGSVVALTSEPGKAAVDGNAATAPVPRSFEGRFVSTRTLFSPRRPYDYELKDEGGNRAAYLDLGKLLLTEQLDTYINRDVVVYGGVSTVPGTRDIVVHVDSLQLK